MTPTTPIQGPTSQIFLENLSRSVDLALWLSECIHSAINHKPRITVAMIGIVTAIWMLTNQLRQAKQHNARHQRARGPAAGDESRRFRAPLHAFVRHRGTT